VYPVIPADDVRKFLLQVHAETAVMRDELSEREKTIREQTEAVAASASTLARMQALEKAAGEARKQGELLPKHVFRILTMSVRMQA
jgi:phosphomevalonate kinase